MVLPSCSHARMVSWMERNHVALASLELTRAKSKIGGSVYPAPLSLALIPGVFNPNEPHAPNSRQVLPLSLCRLGAWASFRPHCAYKCPSQTAHFCPGPPSSSPVPGPVGLHPFSQTRADGSIGTHIAIVQEPTEVPSACACPPPPPPLYRTPK